MWFPPINNADNTVWDHRKLGLLFLWILLMWSQLLVLMIPTDDSKHEHAGGKRLQNSDVNMKIIKQIRRPRNSKHAVTQCVTSIRIEPWVSGNAANSSGEKSEKSISCHIKTT